MISNVNPFIRPKYLFCLLICSTRLRVWRDNGAYYRGIRNDHVKSHIVTGCHHSCECSSRSTPLLLQLTKTSSKTLAKPILSHLYQLVSTRVSKVIYGSLNPLSISHTTQITQATNPSQNAFTSSTGARRLRGSFNIFLTKVSCLIPFLERFSVLFKNFYL